MNRHNALLIKINIVLLINNAKIIIAETIPIKYLLDNIPPPQKSTTFYNYTIKRTKNLTF